MRGYVEWLQPTFWNRIVHPHHLPYARLLHGCSADGEVGVEDVESLFAHHCSSFGRLEHTHTVA